MSTETPDSNVSAPSEQVTAPAQDPLETALLSKWSPGTPLSKKIAEEVAGQAHVSPSMVYKVRKRLSAERAQAPKSETSSEGLQMEVVPTPKAKPAPGQGQAASTAPMVDTTWRPEELEPIFEAANEMIEFSHRGPAPDEEQTEGIAKLWAEAFTAFQVPKGEKGGKLLIGASAVVTTLFVYGPYLRPKKRDASQDAQEPQGEGPQQ